MKITSMLILSVLAIAMLSGSACSKEHIPDDRYYYGKVNIRLVDFPGTSAMDVFFDKDSLGEMSRPIIQEFALFAKEAHLSFYKKGTREQVLDTLINVKQGETKYFSVTYSELANSKAFLARGDVFIASDSFEVQVLNSFIRKTDPIETIDVHVVEYAEVNGNFVIVKDLGAFKNLKTYALSSQRLRFPINDKNGNPGSYAAQLINSKTGQPVIDANTQLDFFYMDCVPGQSYILNIFTDDFGGLYAQKLNM